MHVFKTSILLRVYPAVRKKNTCKINIPISNLAKKTYLRFIVSILPEYKLQINLKRFYFHGDSIGSIKFCTHGRSFLAQAVMRFIPITLVNWLSVGSNRRLK